MKILHIAPLLRPLSSAVACGTTRSLIALAAEQSRKGHEVSIISPRGSSLTSGFDVIELPVPCERIVPIDTFAVPSAEMLTAEELAGIAQCEAPLFEVVREFLIAKGESFDIVHNHGSDWYLLFGLNDVPVPLVHTLHCTPLLAAVRTSMSCLSKAELYRYATVSDSAAAQYMAVCGAAPAVIYNGLPMNEIELGTAPEKDRCFWAGRISPDKGLHTAIESCLNSGKHLAVAGCVYDEAYFNDAIKPMLSEAAPAVEFLGLLDSSSVLSQMRRAESVLFPVERDEPFGMILIEALASGTPIVAFPRGAVPEIVKHRQTGFLAATKQEVANGLKIAPTFARSACRASVEAKFSISRTAAACEDFYVTAMRCRGSIPQRRQGFRKRLQTSPVAKTGS